MTLRAIELVFRDECGDQVAYLIDSDGEECEVASISFGLALDDVTRMDWQTFVQEAIVRFIEEQGGTLLEMRPMPETIQ